MQDAQRQKQWFLAVWIAATVIKVVIAARLPLFVDEAFYWQEGQHLAWAYSDLPGLSAWLARLGSELGGAQVLALRAPFLVIAASLPWLVIAAARELGHRALAWQAGTLTVLMPLAGMLGLLALPDVPMALASASNVSPTPSTRASKRAPPHRHRALARAIGTSGSANRPSMPANGISTVSVPACQARAR